MGRSRRRSHNVVTATVTRLTAFTPDPSTPGNAEALVVAEWTGVLSNTTGTPLRHAGDATLTLHVGPTAPTGSAIRAFNQPARF